MQTEVILREKIECLIERDSTLVPNDAIYMARRMEIEKLVNTVNQVASEINPGEFSKLMQLTKLHCGDSFSFISRLIDKLAE